MRWSRSETTRKNERCAQTLLLHNHFWLLQQTHRALRAIEQNEFSFDELPWSRLKCAIQRIYNACSIDRNQYIRERKHRQKTLVRTGTFLVENAKDFNQPSLIKFSND